MPSIHVLEGIGPEDRSWAGEKAVSLGALIRAGCATPPGFCISAEAYRRCIAENALEGRITQRLAGTDVDDPVELETSAEEVRGWIEHMVIPGDLLGEIETEVQKLHAASLAVRVSRIVEDVVNPRASGLEQAYLAVQPPAVVDYVRQAWATPWTSRAIYYRRRKKMDDRQVGVGVVVQAMANADAAGVMFTGDPLTLAPDEIHIDANWGLGESVNAARWRPQHFTIGKANLTILKREVPGQELMEIAAPEGGLQTVTVPPDKQAEPCLDDAQVLTLAALGKRLEDRMQVAQDIEWCRVGEQLLTLQTRPLSRK